MPQSLFSEATGAALLLLRGPQHLVRQVCW